MLSLRGDDMRMQIKEFAEYTGVSVRTLHYYDEIGLLRPAEVDRSTGYRFYDEQSVLRMQEILFYRELEFSLKSIGSLLSSPNYNKDKALQEQRRLLVLKKERLERLIDAIDRAAKGEFVMNAFENTEFEVYKAEAQARWGSTDAYKEHTEKTKNYGQAQWKGLAVSLDAILGEFARCMKNGTAPGEEAAQNLVKKLQNQITESCYTCTREILSGLGQMYVGDERFQKNIDKHAEGTAAFISAAIEVYCNGR